MNNRRKCLDYTKEAKVLADKEALERNVVPQEHMRQLALAAPVLGVMLTLYVICALHFFGVISF